MATATDASNRQLATNSQQIAVSHYKLQWPGIVQVKFTQHNRPHIDVDAATEYKASTFIFAISCERQQQTHTYACKRTNEWKCASVWTLSSTARAIQRWRCRRIQFHRNALRSIWFRLCNLRLCDWMTVQKLNNEKPTINATFWKPIVLGRIQMNKTGHNWKLLPGWSDPITRRNNDGKLFAFPRCCYETLSYSQTHNKQPYT